MLALNVLDRFSKIRSVVTFVTVRLQQHFVCRVCVCVCVCLFMIYIGCTKFHMSGRSVSLVLPIKLISQPNLHTAAMLLFYIL